MKKKILALTIILLVSTGATQNWANSLNDLGTRIDGATFLEDGFALVNAPEYFNSLKTQLDRFGAVSFLFDLQSRWVDSEFIVRNTDKNGQPLHGDAVDGLIQGTAIRERMAFMLGFGHPSKFGLRTGVLFDYVIASHLSSWFKALGSFDIFNGGGESGFASYAFVSGPFATIKIADVFEISYIAWLKQRHPYDASGAFLSNWVPHYTGTDDNSEGNNLEPWSSSDAGRGDYDGDLFWPEDRVKYRRVFDQVFMIQIAGFNYDVIVAEGVGLAAQHGGLLLNQLLPQFFSPQLFSGFYSGLESLKSDYNFNHQKGTTNFIVEPVFNFPLFRVPQLISTRLNFSFLNPGINNFTMEYHLGTVPAVLLGSQMHRAAAAFPIKLSAGINWFKWRNDGKYYGGYLFRLGFEITNLSMEVTFSRNYESELKKALTRRNDVITEFTLRTKIGG